MLIKLALLVLGLLILVKASDVFVDAASSLAIKLRVPKTLIALTIAAFGTCVPELFISFNSIAEGSYDITLANVIGSCVVNILLIVGVATIINPITLKEKIVKNELPLLTIISGIFFILMNDQLFGRKENGLSRQDAVILIGGFICFLVYLIFAYIHNKPKPRGRPPKAKYKLSIAIVFIILSLTAIAFASDMVVDNAVAVAGEIGISQKFIAMTIIVIGTSLPELVMTITAAKKGEFELAVGNIIGTNIFNICIVLGLPTLIFGGFSSSAFNFIDMLAVIIAAASYYIFGYTHKKLTRAEGVIMVSLFVIYYLYIILN
jgi:cation:H+ antiporter